MPALGAEPGGPAAFDDVPPRRCSTVCPSLDRGDRKGAPGRVTRVASRIAASTV